VNELRRQYDLPELPGGDIILNPVYAQSMILAGGVAGKTNNANATDGGE